MSEVTLPAESGRPTGSRPSRRLRAAGRVPGVIYGHGEPAETVSFLYADLREALTTDAGRNALIRIETGAESHLTVVKDLQLHPVRRELSHVDFVKVKVGEAIEVEVPVVVTGEAKAVTQNQGITALRMTEVLVSVRPDRIPNEFEVDVTDMDLDSTITVADLDVPEGVEVLTDPEEVLVSAELTRAALVDTEEEAEGDEAVAGDDAGAEAADEADGGGSDEE